MGRSARQSSQPHGHGCRGGRRGAPLLSQDDATRVVFPQRGDTAFASDNGVGSTVLGKRPMPCRNWYGVSTTGRSHAPRPFGTKSSPLRPIVTLSGAGRAVSAKGDARTDRQHGCSRRKAGTLSVPAPPEADGPGSQDGVGAVLRRHPAGTPPTPCPVPPAWPGMALRPCPVANPLCLRRGRFRFRPTARQSAPGETCMCVQTPAAAPSGRCHS
jgi:hypothetical protein